MRSLGELLGLSLAWRTRLSVEAPSNEMDEFERFLAEGAAMQPRVRDSLGESAVLKTSKHIDLVSLKARGCW